MTNELGITPIDPLEAASTEIKLLKAQVNLLMEYKTQFLQKVCELRGVRVPCSGCGGTGIQIYNDESTWQHVDGAPARLTKDICEHCWGSGDAHIKWFGPSDTEPTYADYEDVVPEIEVKASEADDSI